MQQKIPHDCMFYESVMAHSSRFLSRAENVTRGGLDGNMVEQRDRRVLYFLPFFSFLTVFGLQWPVLGFRPWLVLDDDHNLIALESGGSTALVLDA